MLTIADHTLNALAREQFCVRVLDILVQHANVPQLPSLDQVRSTVKQHFDAANQSGFSTEADLGLYIISWLTRPAEMQTGRIGQQARSASLSVDERRYLLKEWLDLQNVLPFGSHEAIASAFAKNT